MRIAMVGLGDIAQKAYLPVVANHADITPVICSRNGAVLRRIQDQYRVPESYTELGDLIRARPDAVMVHSSTESHYAIIKESLNAGIPVFVDKPISYHYRECEKLVELAAKTHLPLVVGFNRRFAPLYQQFTHVSPQQVHYQKNRVNLPAPARHFIFDDFIHVLDFVKHCAGSAPADFELFVRREGDLLASVYVQWQLGASLFVAAMNRQNGRNEEQLRYVAHNEHWEINNLASGIHYRQGKGEVLEFGDWEPTLAKRGFVQMVANFLKVVEIGQTDQEYDDILTTHKFCEDVVARIT